MSSLLILALSLPAQGLPVQLPPGAAADALVSLSSETEPATLGGPAWPTAAADWETPLPWARWTELVLAEEQAEQPDAGRRAQLALLAANQGRHLDAWSHFVATGDDPGVAAGLLPRLFPGVPDGTPILQGGRAGALPDGVLLRPILPPLHGDPPYGRPRVRDAEVLGLRIGEAVVDMKLAVEVDGLQVTFTHRSGAPARVRLVLPIPHDMQVPALYVQWERIEEPPAVLELELGAGDDAEAAVWGRFMPRSLTWPTPGGTLRPPATLTHGGLRFEVDPDDPFRQRLVHLNVALTTLLGVPGTVASLGVAPPAHTDAPAPLTIGFPADLEPSLRDAKEAFLISAAERYVLTR